MEFGLHRGATCAYYLTSIWDESLCEPKYLSFWTPFFQDMTSRHRVIISRLPLLCKGLLFPGVGERVSRSEIFSDLETLECEGTMFLPKVGNLLPPDVVTPLKRTESPSTPLWKPQDSHLPFLCATTITTGTVYSHTFWNLLTPAQMKERGIKFVLQDEAPPLCNCHKWRTSR